MLFYTNITIGNETIPFVLMSRERKNDVHVYYDFNQMMASSQLITDLRYAESELYIDSKDSFPYPIPTCISSNYRVNANFTSVFNLFKDKINDTIADGIYDAVANKLNAQSKNMYSFTGQDLKEFVSIIPEFMNYYNEGPKTKISVREDILLNPERTKQIIENNNKNHFSLNFIEEGRNVTKFMENADSPVFLALTPYESLRAGDLGKFPRYGMAIMPFSKENQALRTPAYKTSMSLDFDIQLITGNPDNNDLDIQENEVEFYNAMKELIDFGIKQEYPDQDLEYCVEQGIGSVYVKEYLIELAQRCASWNWSHTGQFPIDYTIDTDDADDDLDEVITARGSSLDSDDGVEGSKSYYVSDDRGVSAPRDCELIIADYINKASVRNVYAPAEAVIKLLRWGYRKPSRLKLKGTDKYLDLNTFRVEALSGSFKGLEVVPVNNEQGGAHYEVLGLIMANGKFKDMNYLRQLGYTNNSLNIPVGVMCVVNYTGGMMQLVMFSMMDLVNHIIKKPNDVFNISISNDIFHTDLSFNDEECVNLEMANSLVVASRSGEKIYYNNSDIADLYLEFTQLSATTSELNILGKYINDTDVGTQIEFKSFRTKQELLAKYASQSNLGDLSRLSASEADSLLKNITSVREYLDLTVAKRILPVILEVASRNIEKRKEGLSPSLEDFLNMYMLAMLKNGYGKKYLEEDSEPTKVEKDLEKMMLFSESPKSNTEISEEKEEKSNDEKERERVINEIIQPIVNPDAVYRLINKVKVGNEEKVEQLGYVAFVTQNGKQKYVLTLDKPANVTVGKSVSLLQIVKIAVLDFYFMINGQTAKSRIRFTDVNAWYEIGKLISQHVK